MTTPLVTVVCLCYNHEKFVTESIESVFNQNYRNFQLIVIDDFSTDGSVNKIREALSNHPDTIFLSLGKNVGNCKAFNTSLPLIRGEFVIDLAADDVLLPERIAEGVKNFEKHGKEYGIHFSDAENISEEGIHLSFHSDRFPHSTIPSGDVYEEVVKRYFISPPSVMMRKEVLDRLNGYDETLAYEDFDLWVRASRDFKFIYSQIPLVKKRVVSSSLGSRQFKRWGRQLLSTYLICEKILTLNKTVTEKKALRKRIFYEIRIALKLMDFSLVRKYFSLLKRNEKKNYSV